WAMLSAILSDFTALEGVSVQTMLAEDHPAIPFPTRRCAPPDEERVFRDLAAEADWTLVIAPQFDDLLLERCRGLAGCGGWLLVTGSGELLLAGDKLAVADYLRDRAVPTPPSYPLAEVLAGTATVPFPAVCKPRHGAGSQSTYLLRRFEE